VDFVLFIERLDFFGPFCQIKLRLMIENDGLDRIDLTIDVQPVLIDELQRAPSTSGDSSAVIKARVTAARNRQAKRFAGMQIRTNKEMNVKQIDELCPLDETSKKILRQAVERLGLSARSYHRTIKVARTIADLADEDSIAASHVAEALQYRQSLRL
jgi:magnesium chelatase family protein